MILIDTEVAALVLRLSPRGVRRLVERGDLTNHGTPRCIKVDLTELSDLAEARNVKRSDP